MGCKATHIMSQVDGRHNFTCALVMHDPVTCAHIVFCSFGLE